MKLSLTLIHIAYAWAAEECTVPEQYSMLWKAPFFSGGGYCSEAISFVKALTSRQSLSSSSPLKDIALDQHGDSFSPQFVAGLSAETKAVLTTAYYAAARIDPSNTIVVCHSEPGAWAAPTANYQTSECPTKKAAYTIGRTMFETDRLPSGWGARINTMDEVWVPSRFHREIFIEGGVREEKVRIVHEPVDTAFYNPESSTDIFPLVGRREGDYIFLSVFKWEERKGWDVLLKAFLQEFTVTDKVALYLLTNSYHSDSNFEEHIANAIVEGGFNKETIPRIVIIPPGIPQSSMPSLYRGVDALVQPSRGEGWGRPHAEAMAMGKPVIATNWSGNTEFMTENNSFLLDIEGLVELTSGPFTGHRWAQPSVVHLRHLMRYLSIHPEEGVAKGKRAREDMVSLYSEGAMGEKVMKIFSGIVKKLHTMKLGVSKFNENRISERSAGR